MNALIIFTKIPIEGFVKTRLIESIGEARARDLAEAMLKDLLRRFESDIDYDILLFYTPEDKLYMIEEYISEYKAFPQIDGDLGSRMYYAMKMAFEMGYEKVTLIGSDIPELGRRQVEDSMSKLDKSDIVFGPSADGGYYLIALKEANLSRDIFKISIVWGSGRVLDQSKKIAKSNELKIDLVDELTDFDREEDLDKIKDFDNIGENTKKIIVELFEKDWSAAK
ncbi:MAG: TIGR04282 family arsenosugar biosynthesis glycosyltransferase [Tissierellia bacterium]|nr:TIGR04282 family arsenosugar biosynthesis glycosyltransferase [Tissierellia bacterium]